MEIVSVNKIWDNAPHNAFTDLVRFNGALYVVFREGSDHVSAQGNLRLLCSIDEGSTWNSVGTFEVKNRDVRDGKLVVFNHKLFVFGAGPIREPLPEPLQSYVWSSTDGKQWSEAVKVAKEGEWLWRTTAHKNSLYGVAYFPSESDGYVALYQSEDGIDYQAIVPRLSQAGYVNESGLLFDQCDHAHCLLRRDPVFGPEKNALLGRAKPPYLDWHWQELDKRIGGPVSFLYQNKHLAVVRLYDETVRTSIVEIHAESGEIEELLSLPSGGDTSYAGVVLDENRLLMSYYSSHEGKTSIYFAVIKL